MPKLAIVLAISTLALAFAPTLDAAPLSAAVDIVNFAFQDAGTGLPVSVASGASVTWTDVSGVHTATAQDGSFDSGPLFPGDSYTVTLPPGAYVYTCAIHPGMRGLLVVA